MTATDYRASLQAQLDIAAEAVIEMLRGVREPDVVVLVAALEAASLLDDVTVGPAHRAARAQVLDAARGSSVLAWLGGTALDLRLDPLPEDDLEREARLHQWVTLAALVPLLPRGAARRVEAFTDEIRGQALARPDAFADLAATAGWIRDQLDLPEDHPAMGLLEDLATEAEAVPAEAVARGYAAARARLVEPPGLYASPTAPIGPSSKFTIGSTPSHRPPSGTGRGPRLITRLMRLGPAGPSGNSRGAQVS